MSTPAKYREREPPASGLRATDPGLDGLPSDPGDGYAVAMHLALESCRKVVRQADGYAFHTRMLAATIGRRGRKPRSLSSSPRPLRGPCAPAWRQSGIGVTMHRGAVPGVDFVSTLNVPGDGLLAVDQRRGRTSGPARRGTGWQESQPGDREVRRQLRLVLRNSGLPPSGDLADLRRKLGLRRGDVLAVRLTGGSILLTPAVVNPVELYTDERIAEFGRNADLAANELAAARRT